MTAGRKQGAAEYAPAAPRHVAAPTPSDAQAQPYVDMLNEGQTSVAGLGVLAAETGLNQMRIGLTGLTEQGLHYAL